MQPQPEPERDYTRIALEYLGRAQANGSESEAGGVWRAIFIGFRMVFIGFVSIAAMLADFILLSGNVVTGIPATLFFIALLAIGVGGMASLFGGASHVSFKKWGKFSGVSALIIALLVIFLTATGLIRIKDIAALSPHQIDASAASASMSNAQAEQPFAGWASVRRSVA